MLELHQFRHSAFCEKVRLVLAAKGLEYSVLEVLPESASWSSIASPGSARCRCWWMVPR
jgi:hypothetical protein